MIILLTMDRFVFYSGSADKKPGKGVNEIGDSSKYVELSNINDWRKVLSNFHVYPFKYDGYTWNSIEHVFQSKKIELVDPKRAFEFTIESGSDIGLGDGKMAQKNRKLVVLSGSHLRAWDEMKDRIMKEAAIEKYKACEYASHILSLTKGAELYHLERSRGKPSKLVHFKHLEEIREVI